MKHQNNEHSFKDPVCGMEVSRLTAIDECIYQGKTYYFCAGSCQSSCCRAHTYLLAVLLGYFFLTERLTGRTAWKLRLVAIPLAIAALIFEPADAMHWSLVFASIINLLVLSVFGTAIIVIAVFLASRILASRIKGLTFSSAMKAKSGSGTGNNH